MGAAHADVAPQAGDAVGVGSDTVQYLLDFGADGDFHRRHRLQRDRAINRLVSFDATPDANARAGYLNGSTNTTLKPLNPTVVLRAGAHPVQRPNGSGAGITALWPTPGPPRRSTSSVRHGCPRPPSRRPPSTAGASFTWSSSAPSHSRCAEANSTNAPAGLSLQELIKIYNGTWTTWNQVPGATGS